MEILLICTGILYVLWLLSMVVMGTTQNIISFTVMFVLHMKMLNVKITSHRKKMVFPKIGKVFAG